MSRRPILVADDDPDFREIVRLAFEASGETVVEAAGFAEAVDVALAAPRIPRIVLLDYFMPGDRDGSTAELRGIVGADRIVLVTACGDVERRAAELGLSRGLPKPVTLDVLRETVRSVDEAREPSTHRGSPGRNSR